jgi:cytochrome c oxidase subunit I
MTLMRGWMRVLAKGSRFFLLEALVLTFIGASVPFFPRHFLGLAGMPRATRTIRFVVGVVVAFSRKQVAGANPWGVGATTLEWTLPSPPAFHSYKTLPRIEAMER